MELEKQQCFTCWFWISLRTQDAEQPDRVVIVDGAHYCYADDAKPRHMAGFGGQEFRIKFHDGREVVTHNLWYQGKIPEWTKEHFPNNAIFVKKSLAKPNTAQC